MPPVFLIGYMGSGKTTLGRAVSAVTGKPFIDLDEYIEQLAGLSVSQIFALKGEEGFRRLERECLAQVAEQTDVIVACGGGTPCFFDNMELMNRCGTTVFLDASIGRLLERLKEGRAKRPLIASLTDEQLEAHITANLSRRMPFYSLSAHTFGADLLDTRSQLDRSTANFIKRFMQ